MEHLVVPDGTLSKLACGEHVTVFPGGGEVDAKGICRDCRYWDMLNELANNRRSRWCSLYDFDKLPTGFCDRWVGRSDGKRR